MHETQINQILFEVFKKIHIIEYALIKLDPIFPYLTAGSDIDLLVKDPDQATQLLLDSLNNFVKDDAYEIYIQSIRREHIQIDLLKDNAIIIRFDIHSKLPEYKYLAIKDSLFERILSESKEKEIKNIHIKVPSLNHELMIRYFEYIEYYSIRPDKIKHINYITESLVDKEHFFSQIHFYTKFDTNRSEVLNTKQSTFINYQLIRINKAFKRYGLLGTIRLAISKFSKNK